MTLLSLLLLFQISLLGQRTIDYNFLETLFKSPPAQIENGLGNSGFTFHGNQGVLKTFAKKGTESGTPWMEIVSYNQQLMKYQFSDPNHFTALKKILDENKQLKFYGVYDQNQLLQKPNRLGVDVYIYTNPSTNLTIWFYDESKTLNLENIKNAYVLTLLRPGK